MKLLTYIAFTVFSAVIGWQFASLAQQSGFSFPKQITIFSVSTFVLLVIGVYIIEKDSWFYRGVNKTMAVLFAPVKYFWMSIDALGEITEKLLYDFIGYVPPKKLILFRNGKRIAKWKAHKALPYEAIRRAISQKDIEAALNGDRVAFFTDGYIELVLETEGIQSHYSNKPI